VHVVHRLHAFEHKRVRAKTSEKRQVRLHEFVELLVHMEDGR